MIFSKETYKARRAELCNKVGVGNILIQGNNHSPRNFRDNYYRFRQDSTFLYYIGLDLAGLNAIIDASTGDTILFGDDYTIDDIVWIGTQKNLLSLAESVGITQVKKSDQISEYLQKAFHYLPPYSANQTLRLSNYAGARNSRPSLELIHAIIEQRQYKSVGEIAEMDKAVNISNVMHQKVIQGCQVGMTESDLVGIASQYAFEQQAQFAYQPILTTQGQILHTHHYYHELREGDMILFDGGLEVASGYCADLTRTFPASGKFTPLQKDLYDIVLTAYDKAVYMAAPGERFQDIHLSAGKVLVEGLKDIGWMKGSVSDAVEQGAHTMFFQCGLGHMIGLDVHDMENLGEQYVGYESPHIKSKAFGLKSLRLAKKLEKGHCITIEPGIYVIPQLIDKFHAEDKYKDYINYEVLQKNRNFGGIRIEDNFLVTEGGNQKLGDDLPLEAAAIEALCSFHSTYA